MVDQWQRARWVGGDGLLITYITLMVINTLCQREAPSATPNRG